jgi:hypothetical protein
LGRRRPRDLQRLRTARFDLFGGATASFGATLDSLAYLLGIVRKQREQPGDGLLGRWLSAEGWAGVVGVWGRFGAFGRCPGDVVVGDWVCWSGVTRWGGWGGECNRGGVMRVLMSRRLCCLVDGGVSGHGSGTANCSASPTKAAPTFKACPPRFDLFGGATASFGAISDSLTYLLGIVRKQREQPGDGLLGRWLSAEGWAGVVGVWGRFGAFGRCPGDVVVGDWVVMSCGVV